ncbi:MAG TPA: hypothetical protein VFY29_12480 [Terriglobia bacterium]|nr:hypothetical protein [Terriglobia bacterium]
MPDVLKALSIAGVILLAVVVFIVMICVTVVNRGEAEMKKHGGGHGH